MSYYVEDPPSAELLGSLFVPLNHCRHRHDPTGWICTRQKGHRGPHVAHFGKADPIGWWSRNKRNAEIHMVVDFFFLVELCSAEAL